VEYLEYFGAYFRINKFKDVIQLLISEICNGTKDKPGRLTTELFSSGRYYTIIALPLLAKS